MAARRVRGLARSKGIQESLPVTPSHRPSIRRRMAALVLEHQGRFLVRQRPAGGVNAGLWEFPMVELGRNHSGAEVGLLNLCDCLGVTPASLEPLARITHSITHYRITLQVFRAKVRSGRASASRPSRWLALERLAVLPFTGAHRKIIAHLREAVGPQPTSTLPSARRR